MNFGRKIITRYDRDLKLWVAVFQNADCDQLGHAGYGTDKYSAIDDLRIMNPEMA